MKELLKGLGLGLGTMIGLAIYTVLTGATVITAYENGMMNGKDTDQQES